MLEHERRKSRQLARTNIEGGLPPSPTLVHDLIKFLNETRTFQGKRTVAILEQMLELEEMAKPISPDQPFAVAPVEWIRHRKKYKVHREIAKRNAMLQTELSKHRFTPHAEVWMGGGGKCPSMWAIWLKDDSSKNEPHLRMVASQALEMILRLTQIGDLFRLRRCNHCGKWLFARFTHQTFCSTKCQQRHYTNTEQWRKHRRQYMRRRYHLLKRNPHLKRRSP